MDDVDRLHDAYDKTDRVARQRDAQARAMAELQQETEKALAEGRPTPADLEKQRQKAATTKPKRPTKQRPPVENTDLNPSAHQKRKAAIPAEIMAEAEAMVSEGGPDYSNMTEALAAGLEALENESAESGRWERGGETVIRWGITTADEGTGAEIGFSVQVDGQEPGVILLDLDEDRLRNWERGLQNADGPRRFAYGIVQKVFETAAMESAALLLGALHEVQEGLHLEDAEQPAESAYEDAGEQDHHTSSLAALDDDDEDDEAPPMSEEAKAFLRENAQGQEDGPTSLPETDFESLSAAAKAFLEKNSGKT